jgi:hypothetical protein
MNQKYKKKHLVVKLIFFLYIYIYMFNTFLEYKMIIDGVRYRKLDKSSKLDQNIVKEIEKQVEEQNRKRENDYLKEFEQEKIHVLNAEINSYHLTRVLLVRYLAFILSKKKAILYTFCYFRALEIFNLNLI